MKRKINYYCVMLNKELINTYTTQKNTRIGLTQLKNKYGKDKKFKVYKIYGKRVKCIE